MALSNMTTKTKDGQADWGFAIPSEGVYTVRFHEGLELKANKKSGKRSIHIPFQIQDEGDEHNKVFWYYINVDATDKDGAPLRSCKSVPESRLADLIIASGQDKVFDDKFGPTFGATLSPFDESILTRVVDLMKIQLIEKPINIRLTHRKTEDGNVMPDINAVARIDVKLENKKTKGNAKPAAAAPVQDWS